MRDKCCFYASLLLLLIAAAPCAHALLVFDDAKDEVYVNASYTFGYDSNIFAQQTARSSSTSNYAFGATYSRRAGVISVNASAEWGTGQFEQFRSQDFTDPSMALGFTKGTGRTTGSLDFGAQKSDVPDPNANNRAISWDYSTALNLRYPVNERYYFTNSASYSTTQYTNTDIFSNLNSFTDAVDLNYVYTSKLDLSTGYTFGYSQTSNSTDYDQSTTVGLDGSIFPKLSGSFDIGVENRRNDYVGTQQAYDTLTSAAALSWHLSHVFTFTGNVNKGFGTSSTDISLDTTSVSLTTDVNAIRSLRTNFVLDYTGTDFLGFQGGGRSDHMWEYAINVGAAVTAHLHANLAWAYMVNYSNFSDASFDRETLSLNIRADY